MKVFFSRKFSKPISYIIFSVSFLPLNSYFINAEYLSESIQVDTSTKSIDERSVIPTNPFEIVEMIRRNNSLNDATNPSDAIDDALKSFNSLEVKKEI